MTKENLVQQVTVDDLLEFMPLNDDAWPHWKDFIESIQDGDEIWSWSNGDAPLAGRWGYCIIRDGGVFFSYLIGMS